MAGDPVRAALDARLKATPALTALLGMGAAGIFHRRAPQPSKPPMIVYDKRSGTAEYNFGGELAMADDRWLVRAVAYGRLADRGEEIAAQIVLALNDAPLVITGRKLLAIYLETTFEMPEQVGKDLFQHSGGVYRIVTAPSG